MKIDDAEDVVSTFMQSVHLDSYVLNSIEQQECILISVGICKSPLLLEQLIEDCDISRNTLISDITTIKKYVEIYHVKLLNKTKQGYYLQGDEFTIRYVIMKAYHYIILEMYI